MTAQPAQRPMAGRTAELEILATALERLGREPRLLAVTGEPGIGKTHLLSELTSIAGARRVTVVRGQASECRQGLPLRVVADAFDGLGADLDSAHLTEEARAVLTSVAPALRAGDGHQMPHEVRLLIECLAGPGLILILDDLHWADEASLDLVDHLLRHPPRGRVLLTLAYRERQAPALLRAGVARAVRAGLARRLDLGPLTPEQARELIGARGSPSWQRAVYRDSGGNPLYLDALLRAGPLEPGLDLPYAGELPEPVGAALLAELTVLSPAARLTAQVAAVAGAQFESELVADIAGMDHAAVVGAFDELAGHDLIRAVPLSPRFAFRHAVVQRVAYESTAPGWRQAAHARTAAALARRGLPAQARAHHVERSAQTGDLGAVSVLTAAAVAVRPQAPATAARWLTTALRLLPAGADPSAILLRLATALARTGRLRESRDALHEVLRLLPPGSAGDRARAVVLCAMVERLLGRLDEARSLLRAELAVTAGRESAGLLLELSAVELMAGAVEEARALARRAVGVADRGGLRVTGLALLAACAALDGDPPTAADHLTRAAALIDGMLDADLPGRAGALAWVVWSEIQLERYADALRHIDRALPLTRDGVMLPWLLLARAVALRWTGRLAEARASAEEAAEAGGDDWRTVTAGARLWIDAWSCADPDEAPWPGAKPTEAADAGPDRWFTALTAAGQAEARLAAGDPGRAISLTRLAGGPDLPWIDPWSRVVWYELLTRAELAQGRTEAAASWASRAAEVSAALSLPGSRGLALLAAAQVAAPKDPVTTARLAVAAAEALAEAGLVVEAARARLLNGVVLGVLGDSGAASAELAAAQEVFDACGAAVLSRRVVSERRRLAARAPRRRTGSRVFGQIQLTHRERQVAELVREGLTNRQIAARLCIKEKTVEMHLSRALAEFGVGTRVALAVALTPTAGG